MISAFLKAFDQFNDPPTRKVVWVSLSTAIAVFVTLWIIVLFLLSNTPLFTWGWMETIVEVLGWLAALVITWILFPGVVSAVTSFLLERVAGAVEARHYPELPPAPGIPVFESLLAAAKFLAIIIILNMALLPFLIIPPLFPFVFYSVNGYLLSREYFEMVAQRRISPKEAKTLRRTHRGPLFFSGVLIAFMLTIPVINLLAPIVATAVMVHFFEGWRRPFS
ncbi:MAG TPA: hypothetical protein ENI79_01590 [Rhodospirillales bacterium]|nr:hypothetical protein [Rhodospirillales bacterium]